MGSRAGLACASRTATWVAALLAGLWAAGSAAAWDNQGHMATGSIAYDELLRTRPQAFREVVRLMVSHPDRARFDRELGPAAGAERDRLLFEYMARWPDDVRRTPYDHPDWHYTLKIVSPAGRLLSFHNGRAQDAYLHQLAVARDPRAPAGERAVALCWVMHIVADMHQPLHAGHWLDARFPASDRAGMLAWIRPAADAPPMRLHVFWDRAGDQAGGEREGAATLAAKAQARSPAASTPPLPADPRAAFDAWAASSRRLAVEDVYQNGRFEGAAAPADAPAPTPDYLARAHDVALLRLGEAGVRLAQVLSTLPDPPPPAAGG